MHSASYSEIIHLWLLHKNRHACDANNNNNNCIGYLGEVHLCALVYRAPVCVCVCVLVRIYAKSHFISHLPFLLVHLWSVTVYVQIMQAPHGKNIILTFTKTMQTQKKTRERERLNNWRQVAPIMKYSSFMFRWGNVYFGMQFLGCAHNPNGTPGERERERERASDQKM